MSVFKAFALIGKVKKAIADAEAIQAKAGNLTEEDKEKGKEVIKELEGLYEEMSKILKTDSEKKEAFSLLKK